MSEEFVNCLLVILLFMLSIISAFISNSLFKKSKKLQQSLETDKYNDLIYMIQRIVEICVESTNQTLVNDLKENDEFDTENQYDAFQRTLQNATTIINNTIPKDILPDQFMVDTLVREMIEKVVADKKTIYCKSISWDDYDPSDDENEKNNCECYEEETEENNE